MNTFRQNLPLYHDATQQFSLGCGSCSDRDYCGGLQTLERLFDCTSLCECNDNGGEHVNSQFVCRNNVEDYVNRYLEVGGWGFENIQRCKPLSYSRLPFVIPLLYGSSGRFFRLTTEAVAVPLEKVFDHGTGALKYPTRKALADYFGFNPSARLLISGVAKDGPIEHYWSLRRVARIVEQLAKLEPELVTVPNFSLFIDVPRWDNLYSMKRIGICWSELVSKGVPTSLHLNARTDSDWERWTNFVGEREEVKSIAYEFATGPACIERGKWHADKLIRMASEINRDLQIVLRGGYYYLREISQSFAEVVFIDTSSFVKTAKRKRLDWAPGEKKHWRTALTEPREPLDGLLLSNIKSFGDMISHYVR